MRTIDYPSLKAAALRQKAPRRDVRWWLRRIAFWPLDATYWRLRRIRAERSMRLAYGNDPPPSALLPSHPRMPNRAAALNAETMRMLKTASFELIDLSETQTFAPRA
ncbi:MAG TPA: hypothetical protein VJJ47_03160 [Candidatus Paceibacterota bacterium]